MVHGVAARFGSDLFVVGGRYQRDVRRPHPDPSKWLLLFGLAMERRRLEAELATAFRLADLTSEIRLRATSRHVRPTRQPTSRIRAIASVGSSGRGVSWSPQGGSGWPPPARLQTIAPLED